MSAKSWIMVAVAIAVAAATYFTLETIAPHRPAETGGSRLVSADDVFQGATAADEDATQTVQAEVAQPLDEADKALLAPSTEIAAGEVPAEDTATDVQTDAVDDEAADGLTDEAAEETVDDTADTATPEPTPSPTATPAPTPTATATPTATPKPTATPAQTERPASSPAAAAPKPATKPAATPAQRLTQWWAPESDTRLSIVYAGSAAYTRALVVLFNGDFDNVAAAQQHLSVVDATGKPVKGTWEIGANNKRMLLFPVAKVGTYTVTVGADLADRNGRKLGTEQKGPVHVR